MKKKQFSIISLAIVGLMLVCSCANNKKQPDNPITEHTCEHVCPECGKCTDLECQNSKCANKCPGHEGGPINPAVQTEKHLIIDSFGDYGGTLNKSKYGVGSPLNGKLDHIDTEYYAITDYYNLKCSETRTILPHFQGYQQTMQDSDGLSCLLMVLNNEGLDVLNTYSEENLVKIQENITHKPVFNNGSTPLELSKVMTEIGFQSNPNPEIAPNSAKWMREQMQANKYVLVRYQDGTRYQWHLVLGVDECSPDTDLDDVIIFADPFDASDHYQDGYSVYHFGRFKHWWLHKLINGDAKELKECLVIDSKKEFNLQVAEKDAMKGENHCPDKHLLLNADGTTGGSYGDGRYYGDSGSPGFLPDEIQPTEHPDYYYYLTPDAYNFDDTDSREVCTGYKTFQQTMSSSCGICSCMMVLEYYGFDWSRVGRFITEDARLGFVGYNSSTNPKFGGVDADANDRKQEAIVLIYCQYDSYFDSLSARSFYNYGGVGAGTLSNVPKNLGFTNVEFGRYYRNNFNESKMPFKTIESFKEYAFNHLAKDEPIIFCWNPMGGHYETVISIDDMGTEEIWDDVVILADSYDFVDHYRDGYNTVPLDVMYGTWYNSSGSTNQAYVCFSRDNNKNVY